MIYPCVTSRAQVVSL